MFKKIDETINYTQVNKSQQKAVRNKLITSYPIMEHIIDEILPKKSALYSGKLKTIDYKFELLSNGNEILFFQKEKDEKVYPTLKLLHKYPDILPKMRVDQGGIKFVLGGANVMCPGLTSKGGNMDDVKENQVVGIYAEGKTHALAIGVTKLSKEEIMQLNKGIGIETFHYLNDGLWHIKEIKKK